MNFTCMKITVAHAPDFHILNDEREKRMVVKGEFVFDVK